MSMLEKARAVALQRNKGAEAKIDHSNTPKAVGKRGSRVRITKGEEIDNDGTTTISRLDGVEGKVDGAPYVAKAGPNAGKVIQPILTESGALLGVPTDRLKSSTGSTGHSRPKLGWSRSYESNWEKAFGRRS